MFLRKLFGGNYNKALVPLAMAAIYFLNQNYGIDIPLNEMEVTMLFGIVTSLVTWLVPNKDVN